MRFVVDENLGRELVEHLRQQGHQVYYIPEVQPGLKNGAVLAFAQQQQAVLITGDKTDFGRLIFQQRQPCLGLVVVRVSPKAPSSQTNEQIMAVISMQGEKLLGNLMLVAESGVRTRSLLAPPLPPVEPEDLG